MAKLDPAVVDHLEWLGFVQPTGLVVSAPALVRAGAILDRRDAEGQRLLQATTEQQAVTGEPEPIDLITDFQAFAQSVLGWSFSPKAYAGTTESPTPEELSVPLPDYEEVLRPDFAVRELDPADGASPWQLLVRTLPASQGFDSVERGSGHLEATPTNRMERLLRETRVPAGLLFNGRALRLISAPRGESSGWLDFKVSDMLQTAGRPICTALRLLLSETRLLSLPRNQRLAALLDESRKFQNEVSEKLAEQVLHALYELLRGFQSAHDASGGLLLRDPLQDEPDEVYRAWLTVILRLVFLLYAEERDMLPTDDAYLQHYSLTGLYERLREDAALFPDTMDQRFGAWAQLLVLFRIIFDGAETLGLPRRHGALFDPDRFPFLEGRRSVGSRQVGERIQAPLVPDGTIYRILEDLLVLNGERISYRALDVEQIGSVYETMMGFRLEAATGTSVAVKAEKKQGAPTALDLEQLLAQSPKARPKWVQDRAERKLASKIGGAIASADTIEDLHAGLEPVIDRAATPDLVPKGAMVLQPSQERRRSGSHYTPRSLTEPIVRTTLEPILARLRSEDGRPPTPEQILDLKVCDPAMGSGAFLVEACRQLGEALIESWHRYDQVPFIPTDEDEVILARRLVAQRCLYGVDRNPVAVDLAKVSLWLATLAKSHALTFLDHALRHGDSLVGLSRQQIEAFHWEGEAPGFTAGFEAMRVQERMARVAELRVRIREAGDQLADWEVRDLWNQARFELDRIRLFGDLVVAAFFEADKPKGRESKRALYAHAVSEGNAEQHGGPLDDWRRGDLPLAPFHWELEFPEVFARTNPGFDVLVGNPPFGGKNNVLAANPDGILDWLKHIHPKSHGNSDLVAHFFRRGFDLIRREGALGLLATNTVAQGDTRATGLRWICTHGGEIYSAARRYKWPGMAAVVVSVIHILKGSSPGPKVLDGRSVDAITAFLFHSGGHDDPIHLVANEEKSFVGCYVLGMGFTFDDAASSGTASSLADMKALIEQDSANQEVIRPYVGGEEVNDSPTHAFDRYVIDFDNLSEEECRKRWPDVLRVVEEKVMPERTRRNDKGTYVLREPLPTRWWQYAEKRPGLRRAVKPLKKVLVTCRHQPHWAVTYMGAGAIFAESLIVVALDTYAAFCSLQSRPHEVWARFFGSSLEDRLRYTPSDCFETFPFPKDWEELPALESAGKEYYEFRADLMVRNDEGLTKTYNRFHDPNETNADIVKLRNLHAAMDRSVLDAYGWDDIPTGCEFILDYEEDDGSESRRKKPWRYRWPDEVHDEVLARLLALNAEYAAEEARAGKGGRGSRARRAKATSEDGGLFS